jgi:hypothetical protein
MKTRLSAAFAVVLLVITMIAMVFMHTPVFGVSGSLSTPLRPGASAPIDLALTNQHSYSMTVTAVSIRVTAVTDARTGKPSRCSASNFVVRQPVKVLPLAVAAHSTLNLSDSDFPTSSWPAILMRKTKVSQDECKNVALQISYTAADAFWGKP